MEIETSASIARKLGLKHDIIRAPLIKKFGLSNPNQKRKSKKPEFWPFRNQFIATVAAMHFSGGGAKEIWFGLLAPAGTPIAIADQLNHAVNESLKSAEVRASLAKLGMEAKIGTAQDFASALAEQARDWKSVVEATGIKVD